MSSQTFDKSPEKTIELDFPIQLADRQLSEVTMRRPRMADFLKHDKARSPLEKEFGMIADLCGLTGDDLEKMDCCDYEKLLEQLFLFRGEIR